MKRFLFLIAMIVMITGLSPPTVSALDIGAENRFTVEQSDMDITITMDQTVILETIPYMTIHQIALEGTVIIYLTTVDKDILDQTAELQSMNRLLNAMTRATRLSSDDTNLLEIYSQTFNIKEGSPQLEIGKYPGTWPYQETYI